MGCWEWNATRAPRGARCFTAYKKAGFLPDGRWLPGAQLIRRSPRRVDYLAGHGPAVAPHYDAAMNIAIDSVRRAAPPAFGEHLRHWRQRRRLSQSELAEEAEISPRHLSFVET
ncbi:MAG: transcriptional regulator, family, partial [Ramlibacter sp.]|nr:transcriptional regulator, family [Ramlibacter sp.]